MALLFCVGLILYYLAVFRARGGAASELSRMLWVLYFGLGLSASFIALTDVLQPVYPANYPSALYLLLCVLIAISGFLRFRSSEVLAAIQAIPHRRLIENVLIVVQYAAIAFFLPFAIGSLMGDANENRLDIESKMDLLGSYGIINTAAGAASQLFSTSLVMAFARLTRPVPRQQNAIRALLLLGASLSYVVYILAYVGRDGIAYWLMTAAMVFIVFRPHMSRQARGYSALLGALLLGVLLVPFIVITVSRFVGSDYGATWSVLDYFGSQVNNFSDYSSIDRPLTFGAMNFPMFIGAACSVVGLDCPTWLDLKELIFSQYLEQDKAPWLFGTFVSDFVADFGYWGTFALIVLFALVCDRLCASKRAMTLQRLLLILFVFLVPYWGVFYFRFSIVNGFIVVNLVFILFIRLLYGFRRAPMRMPDSYQVARP